MLEWKMPGSSITRQLFLDEPAGRFALGHVFRLPLDGESVDSLASDDIGHWSCDIADGDRLTWSDKVYELFGIPVGTAVDREQALQCYSDQSRDVLERLRPFAIGHRFGFILDAALGQTKDSFRWIRILAIPVVERDLVVGLRGLKRTL
jgi:hypothetical protein